MTTFYKKVGRRYVPVSEYDTEVVDSYPTGTHLFVSKPGTSIRRYNVNPEFAPLIAAGIYAEDAVTDAIFRASEMRPEKQPLTEEQVAAWAQLKQAFSNDYTYLQYPSCHEITRAGVTAMQEEAKKLLTNPSVKKAWEQFMLMCELSKRESND